MIVIKFYSWPLIADASKTGVAQEAVQNIRRGSKTMAESEARQILGVTENSPWEDIVQVLPTLLFLFFLFLFIM